MGIGDKIQVSVSYIGDLPFSPPDNVILVERDAHYVEACYQLSQHKESGGDIHVWVRLKNHYFWLRDFTNQIGCNARFEEKTPRLLLAEKWNVNIPEWLTSEKVLEHRLLEIDVESKNTTDFEDRYLSHCLGSVFELEYLSSGDIVPLVNVLVDKNASKLFEDAPLLHRCLEIKCEQWAARSEEDWVHAICERIPENYKQVWQWLSLWACLYRYPDELLEYVIPPERILRVRKIPPDTLSDLPIEPDARDQILSQIDLLFKRIRGQINSSNEFQKVVGWMSGRFYQEYDFIIDILKSKRLAPSKDDIRLVQENFENCSGVTANQLKSLLYYVKPARPRLIGTEEEWNQREWVDWSVKEYIPYRTWQIHNSYFDEELEDTVARFSDWYVENYISIYRDPDLSIIHSLRNISTGSSEREFTIILLVDCLPIEYLGLLDNAIQSTGLRRKELNYKFAGLPTTTEFNKSAILAGEMLSKSTGYEAILKNRAAIDWGGRKTRYFIRLKDFSDMSPPEESIIAVLNFIDGDELLHSDVESKNTSYEDELYRLFMRIADAVDGLSKKWNGPEEGFNVYVITDHGACRILEEEKHSSDSEFVRKLFDDEKHRFSIVPDNQVDKIPQNLWSLGHKFKHPFLSDGKTFFLPKGHNTVRQSVSMKGFMHGGVTPEEVIVPTVTYSMIPMAWRTPSVRFLNLDLDRATGRAKLYIQRIVRLEIEVQNPNNTEIHIHRASVMSPEADLKNFDSIYVPGGSKKSMVLDCYFKKSALGVKLMEIQMVYKINGEQYTKSISIESEFKSAVTSGFNLRDL